MGGINPERYKAFVAWEAEQEKAAAQRAAVTPTNLNMDPSKGAYNERVTVRRSGAPAAANLQAAARDAAAGIGPISLDDPSATSAPAAAGQEGNLNEDYALARKPVWDAQAAALNDQTRRKAGISVADASPGHKWNSAWSDGTFKSAGERLTAIMSGDEATKAGAVAVQARLAQQRRDPSGNYRPATPPLSPAVGGTIAVPDSTAGLNGNTRTPRVQSIVDRYAEPGAPARTTFDSTPGTRRPFIAGANRVNVVRPFLNPDDPTLDKKYVAGLPRPRPATQTIAVRPISQPRKRQELFTQR